MDPLFSNKMQILSLRMFPAPKAGYGRKMHKNLKVDEKYDFCQGVILNDDVIEIQDSDASSLYNISVKNRPIGVTINAIVGANGAGKSTIVDYIIRILNNLSACVFGEYYRTPSAEHLHFICWVYAELYVKVAQSIFRLSCKGNRFEVYEYVMKADDHRFYKQSQALIEVDMNRLPDHKILSMQWDKLAVLKRFCYSIINNYSMYAFQPQCYNEEVTDYKKESEIHRLGKRVFPDVQTMPEIRKEEGQAGVREAQSWMKGLFWKNDGYQVPIVITPMRSYGQVNVKREHKLAKERMLSLVFKRNEEGSHYFKRINGKLVIDGIVISKDYTEELRYKDAFTKSDWLDKIDSEQFKQVASSLQRVIRKLCILENDKKDHAVFAWNYIISKVIKIIHIYPRYVHERKIMAEMCKAEVQDLDAMAEKVMGKLLRDHSHATRKLYRCIYYLSKNHINKKKYLNVEAFGDEIEKLVIGDEQHPFEPRYADELLPPPIFHINFRLYDDMDEKHSSVEFSSLSSGEKQVTYTLSSFYYQLANIDSVDEVIERKELLRNGVIDLEEIGIVQPDIASYKHVCIIFDEIELYFHPEMQRTFISNLLDGLKQMDLKRIESIQVIMATHSPFILSDISKDYTLFLSKDGTVRDVNMMYTLGANIHTMLKNSFFLQKGTMGAFIQDKLSEAFNTINMYCLIHEALNINNSDHTDKERELSYLWSSNLRTLGCFLPETVEKLKSMQFDEFLAKESKLLEEIEALQNMIQEPIVKESMAEQITTWKEYVAFANR